MPIEATHAGQTTEPEEENVDAADRRPVGGVRHHLPELIGASTFGVIVVVEVVSTMGLSLAPRFVAAVVAAVVQTGALVFVRRSPLLGYFANGAATIALIALGVGNTAYTAANLIALYFAAAAPPRTSRTNGDERHQATAPSLPVRVRRWAVAHGPAYAALLTSQVGVVYYFARFPAEGNASVAAMVVLLWTAVWLIGRVQGSRRQEESLRHERDLSAELAEVRRVRLALESERADMAQELHDILGHTLNVMMVYAGAARRSLPADPDAATTSLETIERTGRAAMEDLDRLVGLMRRTNAPVARRPLPGLDELPELVATVGGGTASTIRLDVAAATEQVPQPVQLTAYRITQEALTNVIKHAGAASVAVSVGLDRSALQVVVSDDGCGFPGGDESSVSPTGRGVLGMRERAESHGGDLVIASRPAGGTVVTARLPL